MAFYKMHHCSVWGKTPLTVNELLQSITENDKKAVCKSATLERYNRQTWERILTRIERKSTENAEILKTRHERLYH